VAIFIIFRHQKKNIDEEDYKEKVEQEMSKMVFKDIQTTIDKLKNPDLDSRNYITTILSTYQFNDTKEKSLLNIFTSPQVISTLASLLDDDYYQIKYNAISALSNIIISYSDTDIDKILLTQTNFCELSIKLIKDFTNVEKNSNNFEKSYNEEEFVQLANNIYSSIKNDYIQDINNDIKETHGMNQFPNKLQDEIDKIQTRNLRILNGEETGDNNNTEQSSQ